MKIQRLGESGLKREYGILCQRVDPAPGAGEIPFGAAWCVIEPGGSTTPHRHSEAETFFILEGRGVMSIGDERAPVSKGDAPFIPPQTVHAVENASESETLVFLSTWWERRAARTRRARVTAAPPTPNGDLHLGHLSGPYIAADARRRYLGLRGVSASTLTGSDDHQSYVAAKAEQAGQSPEAVAGRYARSIERTLADANIAVDRFVKPQDEPAYRAFVQDSFRRLAAEGKLIPRRVDSLYCEPCGRHLYEAWAGGLCPRCGSATNAHGCEQCAFINDGIDLRGPRCNRCRRPASARPVVKFYFPLSRYADELRRFHGAVAMSARLRELAAASLDRGLADIGVSHVSDWGIPVPVPDFEGQTVSAWFEMAMGYAQAAEPDLETEQFFGFDNAFFYAAVIPAMMLARDPAVRLPAALICNEFLRLDGSKFSTSRGHAIWADELLAKVGADALRFGLSYCRPEKEQTNFTLEEFGALVEGELTGQWEAWINGLDRELAACWGRRAPARLKAPPEATAVERRLRALVDETARAYDGESFSTAAAARALCELVREGRGIARLRESLPGTGIRDPRRDGLLMLELTALRTLAFLAAPLMPEFSERTLAALGLAVGSIGWESSVASPQEGMELRSIATREFSRAARALREFRARRGWAALVGA